VVEVAVLRCGTNVFSDLIGPLADVQPLQRNPRSPRSVVSKSVSRISRKLGSGTRKARKINSRNPLLVFGNQRNVIHRPG